MVIYTMKIMNFQWRLVTLKPMAMSGIIIHISHGRVYDNARESWSTMIITII
jgi:hypothetical protein